MNKKIKELNAKVDALKAEILELANSDWPKTGDEYWCIGNAGNVYPDIYENDDIDRYFQCEKNFFRTREQVQAVKDAKDAIRELQDGFEPDWSDCKQQKYYVDYDHEEKKLFVHATRFFQNAGVKYFRTYGDAEKAFPHSQVLFDNGAF